MAGKFTSEKLAGETIKLGLPNLMALFTRPDLIPAMRAALS